jgi:hypothetical protein
MSPTRHPLAAVLLAACTGLLAACATAGGGPRPPGASGDARWLTGTWQGGYHCATGFGDARLTLTLEGRASGRLEGVFAFQVAEPFTQIPPGSFRVAGAHGAEGRVRLAGTRWIDWPAGQKMVGLDGAADRARGSLSGTVPGCGEGSSFYLEKLPDVE